MSRWHNESRPLARLKAKVRATQPLCARCGQPWDPTVHWSHPQAFSLGHIIPKSRGGLDVESNVRAEHFGCNRAASDRETLVTPSDEW